MYSESKIILDGRLEIHTDGTVYKLLPDGVKKKAHVTVHKRTKQAVIEMQENGQQKHYNIKRIIAEAFIPNPENKPYVTCKDGDPSNIRADNLEWISRKERAAKAAQTRKAGDVNCIICGKTTRAEGGICAGCRRAEKEAEVLARKKAEALERIAEKLKGVDSLNLTPLQHRAVGLRMQGMTYEAIGSVMGCSRQNVEGLLNTVLTKSTAVKAPGKCVRKAYMSAQRRLDKRRKLLNRLNAEVEAVKAKISESEQTVKDYEFLYGGIKGDESL